MPPTGEGPDPGMGTLRTTLQDPVLRRLTAAWLAVNAGKWAFLVTTLVSAYAFGGPVAVGLLGLARFLVPTVIAPFAGLPTVRWRPEVVLRAVLIVRALAIALAAGTLLLGLPFGLLYACVALEAGAGAFTRPIHMGLLPAVARTPAQLIGANVTSSAAEGLGTFLGPALAGTLLIITGPAGSALAVLAIYALGVAAIAGLEVPAVGRPPASVSAVAGQLSGGLRALGQLPGPRLIILCLGLQTFVRGLLTVLIVVAAIELLPMGEPGVGALNAALGLGGLLGAVGAISLAGRARLGPPFAVALAGWGAPIAVIGLVADPLAALVAMLAVGVSNAFLDVAGFTLLQRTTPNAARVAVLGLVDAVANGGVALGGVLAPILVAGLGIQGALLVAGSILPIAALLASPALLRLAEGGVASAQRVAVIRRDPLLAPLSLATVEHLAGSLSPAAWAPGALLMREGEPGTDYLLIEAGEVEISQAGTPLRRLGPGEGLGEIALLRDVPRTASAQARTPVTGFRLQRADFLEAVTGHAASRALATGRVEERLAADTERPALH